MGQRTPGEPPPDEGLIESWQQLFGAGAAAQLGVEETELPALDVFEAAGELVIEAELPGVNPAAIGIAAGEGLLVIEGNKEEQPVPGRVNYLCMERAFGAFRRVVLIGAAIDLTRAVAEYRDGVLQIRIPKIAERRGRLRVIPVAAVKTGERREP